MPPEKITNNPFDSNNIYTTLIRYSTIAALGAIIGVGISYAANKNKIAGGLIGAGLLVVIGARSKKAWTGSY